MGSSIFHVQVDYLGFSYGHSSLGKWGSPRNKEKKIKENFWKNFFFKGKERFQLLGFISYDFTANSLIFCARNSLPVLSVKEDKGTSHHSVLNQLLALDSALRSHYSQGI